MTFRTLAFHRRFVTHLREAGRYYRRLKFVVILPSVRRIS